jgi:hypothetical protein
VTGGRCDEARPDLAILADRISDNEMVIFEDSSHLASIEERELYLRTIDEFPGSSGDGWRLAADACLMKSG